MNLIFRARLKASSPAFEKAEIDTATSDHSPRTGTLQIITTTLKDASKELIVTIISRALSQKEVLSGHCGVGNFVYY